MCKKRKKKPRINRPKFKVFKFGRRWKWFLEAHNGKLYAQCGYSYRQRRDCVKAIEAIKNMASQCEIKVEDA